MATRWLARSIGAFVFTGIAYGACGSPRSGGDPIADTTTAAAETAIASDSLRTVTVADSLRIEIVAPYEIAAGSRVPITLKLTNATTRPIRLYLMGREIAFDFIVTGSDGSVVWRRLEGQAVPAILRIELVEPAGVLELEDVWDQRTNEGRPVDPGSYSIRGLIPTDAEPLTTEPVSLRIHPE